ncbi:nucleoplasmin-3 [Discoglossus pictus]
MNGSVMQPGTDSYLFGCELSAKTKNYTFQVDEEDASSHSLSMNTISLGEGAKEESNIVEVVGRNRENEEITVQVANLNLSCQPMVNLDYFLLHPPVMFRLKSGSGPVVISGNHIILHDDHEACGSDCDSEEEEEDSDEEEEMFVPIKQVNKKLRVK